MLGAGNESEARAALAAFPEGLQIGGGVNAANARDWLDAGASHVIVTSWVFREGRVDWARLEELVKTIGKEKLVLDLSCRKRGEDYVVVTDRWQKFTELTVSEATLKRFSEFCSEFLIHAVDVEGLCRALTANWWKNSANGHRFRSPMPAVRIRWLTWRPSPDWGRGRYT